MMIATVVVLAVMVAFVALNNWGIAKSSVDKVEGSDNVYDNAEIRGKEAISAIVAMLLEVPLKGY